MGGYGALHKVDVAGSATFMIEVRKKMRERYGDAMMDAKGEVLDCGAGYDRIVMMMLWRRPIVVEPLVIND